MKTQTAAAAWQHIACAMRVALPPLAAGKSSVASTGVDWLAAQLAVSVQRGRAQRATRTRRQILLPYVDTTSVLSVTLCVKNIISLAARRARRKQSSSHLWEWERERELKWASDIVCWYFCLYYTLHTAREDNSLENTINQIVYQSKQTSEVKSAKASCESTDGTVNIKVN